MAALAFEWIHCIYVNGREEHFGVRTPLPGALRVGDGPPLFQTGEVDDRGNKIYREAGSADRPDDGVPYPLNYRPNPEPCPSCGNGQVELIMWDYFGHRLPWVNRQEEQTGGQWSGLRGIMECGACLNRFHFYPDHGITELDTSFDVLPL